jgi:hypothetical protein
MKNDEEERKQTMKNDETYGKKMTNDEKVRKNKIRWKKKTMTNDEK